MNVALIGELYKTSIALLGMLNVALCIYIWTSRRTPGAFVGGCITLAAAEVCLMFHLLLNTTSPEAGFVYARLRFLGLAALNPLLLIYFLQYTRQTRWLKPPIIAALFIIPVLTQIVLWFTPSQEQFFSGWQMVRIGGYAFETSDFTGWYYVHVYYGGVLMFLAIALLIWYTQRVDSSRRRDLYILAALVFIGTVGAAKFITIGPAPGLKVTPIVIGIVSVGIMWVLIGGSTQRVMPVAYDLIFASIHDAVLVLDPNGSIVKANPAAERVFQRPAEEFLFQPVGIVMSQMHGWTDHDSDATFEVSRHNGERLRTYEGQHLPLTGGLQSFGSLIVLRDVTARREAMALNLERQRSQIINSFIADASHEFRTPLSVIKSSAYLLGRQTGGPTGARHVFQINEYADRINALVDDLQLIASLDSDEPLGREPIDIAELVTMAVEGFGRTESAAKNQTMTLSVDGSGLPMLRGDSEKLLLALQKILHNAVRYTPTGGTISVNAARHDSSVQIKITDSGIGMDAQTAQAAPQRFYRLDSARTTAGFGLGLSIAQRIVERQGGTLAITSAPGHGTTVTIMLPQVEL